MTWLIAALALLGNVLVIRQRREGFALWIVTNAWLIWHNVGIGEYGQAAMFGAYLVLAVWGWLAWTKAEADSCK